MNTMETESEPFDESCRACLAAAGLDFRSLGVDFSVKTFEILSGLRIEGCEGPKKLCRLCANILAGFQQFRAKCKVSDATLKTYYAEKRKLLIHVDIKKEMDDSDSDDIGLAELAAQNRCDFIEMHPVKVELDPIDTSDITISNISSNSIMTNIHDCGLCDESGFRTIGDLSSHLERHKEDPDCHKCFKSFGEWTQMLAHRFEHLPADREIICHICQKKIPNARQLHLHVRKNHVMNITCNICKREFAKYTYLKKHLEYAHNEARPFKCGICSKRFKTGGRLKIHSRCHDDAAKKYKCSECDFSCKLSSNLKGHISRRHATDEHFTCPICNKDFTSSVTFKKHVKSHNKLHICPQCGKKFSRGETLKLHLLSHNDEKPYPCSYCPSRFKLPQQVKIHERSHTGERPFKCCYCPMAFATHGILNKHKRTHTGERPYVCRVCGKGFTGTHNLKVHMKVHGEYLVVKKEAQTTTP